MTRRTVVRKLLPAGVVSVILALAALLPAAPLAAFLAGYGYSFGGNLHSGPTVNPPSGSQTDVFVVGADNAVWRGAITSPGNGFSGWASLQGVALQRPGSTFTDASNEEVYVRGADSAVWTRQKVAGTWGAWTSLGGNVSAGVDAVNFGGNTYLLARGSDSVLWFRKRTGTSGSTWGAWTKGGGTITSSPTGLVVGSNLLVFVRGGDNGIWFTTNGSNFATFNNIHGNSDSAVAGVSCSAGHANVFVVAADSTLWESHSTDGAGATWTAWAAGNPAGSKWTSDLGATCNTGTITIYGRGLDYAMWSWTGISGA